MNSLDDIKDLVLRMEDICHDAGVARFDRVRLVTGAEGEPDEVWFVWDEEQKVVAVSLDDGRPEALTEALSSATGGDPVLN